MEPSPLTQQERPVTFQPKIAQLYSDLFSEDDQTITISNGFWSEFFLLRPDTTRLQQQLDSLSSGNLLTFQHECQQLFARAVAQIKNGKGPMDENALDVSIISRGLDRLATYLSDPGSVSKRNTWQEVRESEHRYHHHHCWP